jgi:F-type H+-transporting ATPase subunit gamma
MPSLKAIRKRIGSVKSTQQITKAMKMVAAAKLRRAQMAAVSARPYAERLETLVAHLVTRVDPESHPLMRVRERSTRSLVLFVSSDRGLCGAYNSALTRALEAFLREQSTEHVFLTVGRKGQEHLKRLERSVLAHLSTPTPLNAPAVAREIARTTERRYLDGEVDQVHVVYNAFRSTLSQVPTVEPLLPLSREIGKLAGEGRDYLFEPSAAEIIATLLPRLLEVRILHALLEAGASELAARMTAMDAATRNASEMIDTLTLQMNRARQAAITKELMEIIGGAEALKG